MTGRLLSVIVLSICVSALHAQVVPDTSHELISSKYIAQTSSKATELQRKLDRKSAKAIAQLRKQEQAIINKLKKTDSAAASALLADCKEKFKELGQRLENASSAQYIPSLDSLSTSLKFLQANPQLLAKAKETKEKLDEALEKVKGLDGQLRKAEEIQKFLKERKQFLKDQLSKFGFAKELKKLNKQVYYYAQQVKEYQEMLKDPKKLAKKSLELLSKTKLFQDFYKKHSLFASLFRMPGDPNDPSYLASLAGLQTRAQITGLIQQQVASGGPNAAQQLTQNLQAAQAELTKLKSKIAKMGGGASDIEMPEGFKPNNQKTKGFLQRLELGTSFQSQRATNYFPVTSDIGLTVGYKLNDKSIIGIGASYKLGLGRGWENIRISHQGAGFKSFVDWKIKGSFWISGGFEMNYRPEPSQLNAFQPFKSWQQSGLIGISRSIPVRTKFFKKTKLMLLWDFLSQTQVPRTQPIVFRIGYNLN